MVLEKKIFKSCYHIFTIISPLEKVTIHYDKLESSSVRMIGVKFYWKWHSGSREDENVKRLQTDGQQAIKIAYRTWAFNSSELIVVNL